MELHNLCVGGAKLAAVGAATCVETLGAGCVVAGFGGFEMLAGWDNVNTGTKTAIDGRGYATTGGELLQMAGLSAGYAEMGYAGLQFGAGLGGIGLRPTGGNASLYASAAHYQDASVLGANGVSTTLSNIESRFAGASRDVGFIVDSGTGQILGSRRAGLSNGAEIRLSLETDYPLMKGNIFTHNHPLGGNLSPGDVSTALGAGTAEFRAASSSRTISIMFDNPPSHIFGDPISSVLFMDAEKVAIGASYRSGIGNGSLLAPTDLAAKKIWMSDYILKKLAARNSWINYTATRR